MFGAESNESLRLTIAGALWKLNKDPVFMESLIRAKDSSLLRVYAHLLQVLWLNDERAIDLLLDLLPPEDHDPRHWAMMPFRKPALRMLGEHQESRGAGPWALSLLNYLEAGHHVPPDGQHPPSYYQAQRKDPVFRETMVRAVQKTVSEMHQGR